MVVSLYVWFWEKPCIDLNTSVNQIKFRVGHSGFIIVTLKTWFIMLDLPLDYVFHTEEILKISGKQKSNQSGFPFMAGVTTECV